MKKEDEVAIINKAAGLIMQSNNRGFEIIKSLSDVDQEENNLEYVRIQASLTIKSVLYHKGISLRKLRAYDEFVFLKVIGGILVMLSKSFNVNNNISSIQAIDISYTLEQTFPGLTVEQLMYIFQNAKTGKYGKEGKTFGRVDVEIVCGWVNLFYSSDEYLRFLERENSQYKEPRGNASFNSIRGKQLGDLSDHLNIVLENLQKKKIQDQKEKKALNKISGFLSNKLKNLRTPQQSKQNEKTKRR